MGHSEDLPFIFHMPVAELSLEDAETNAMIDAYTGWWTNFAKHGLVSPVYLFLMSTLSTLP